VPCALRGAERSRYFSDVSRFSAGKSPDSARLF